jgi:hypothetical protein
LELKSYKQWKPTDGEGTSKKLKEGVACSFDLIKNAIESNFGMRPQARAVLLDLVMEFKMLFHELFVMEVNLVFTDLAGIPLGPDSVEYWRAWGMPHLFFCHGVDDGLSTVGAVIHPGPDLAALDGNLTAATPTPGGWAARSVCLSHRETGGSTSGCWTFVVWYPPGFPWVEPLVWEPQGGTPLLCCVNNRVWALPFHGTCHSGVAGERVV